MARQPLQIALDPKLVEAMDGARGDVPRSLWIARAVERALSEQDGSLARRVDQLERRVELLAKGRKQWHAGDRSPRGSTAPRG